MAFVNQSINGKLIIPTGVMSNLVGMYAIIWDNNEMVGTAYILGKADDKYFIVEHLSIYSFCTLAKLDDMINWTFHKDEDSLYFSENYFRKYGRIR